MTVVFGCIQQHLTAEEQQCVQIVAVIVEFEKAAQFVGYFLPIDRHKETFQIVFKHPTIARIIRRMLPNGVPQAFDARQRALVLAAVETLVDERLLQQRLDAQGDPVVHDAVAEIGGEDLALDGFRNDECDRTVGRIGAGVDFVAQAQQVLLVPQTERNGIRRAVLVLTADPVSRKQVVVTYADISRCVFNFLLKFGHRAHVVVVVLIVVVRVTVVHIHVPRAPLYALFFGDCLALNSE